ncbi:hypothetical protein [Pseudomonas sp. AU12215]|uniref:hypothetical protein n=1 Tax=Pseudomonas sp. AU12215 TaxID=1860123 RepID=UPI0007EE678F|nr:hypothetical protein [Pseudomonas sp. AU12215]OBY58209.1 hypothetical protein A9513_011950 [Pseudomonas sp. AU12215]
MSNFRALAVMPFQRPLVYLTPCLKLKLALVNQVSRALRERGARVMWCDLDGDGPPRLRVIREGGPLLLVRIGRFRLDLLEEPTIQECTAYLLGCLIEWRREL